MSPKFTPPVLGNLPIRWLAALVLVVMFSILIQPQNLVAGPIQTNASETPINVRVGLGGNIRLGKWTPIFFEVDSATAVPVRFETEVLDGDDTPVVYSGDLLTDPQKPNHFQAWTRIGRMYGVVSMRLYDGAGTLVSSIDLPLRGEGKLATIRESTREHVLTLEPEKRFKEAIESVSAAGARDKTRIVTAVGVDDDLPLSWLGYDGVDSVMLVTGDLERIAKLTEKQLWALETWVKKGGTLIYSSAKNGSTLLAEGGKLARFCPGKFLGSSEFGNSRRLETFCESREQLIPNRGKPIPISSFESEDLQVTVHDGKLNPLIVRSSKGLGRVVFAAFDLDSPRLTEWKGFKNLISRMVSVKKRQEDEQTVARSNRGNSVSHFGYEDMIGQLRVPLDRFTGVKFVRFALIAALIALYILCIGPGDYFLLKKVFGKMELTWLTFPLVSLLFCGLAVGISYMTRPNSIQLNQLEIIDVDSVDGRVRGSVWTNLYSPRGENCSLEIDPAHQLGFEIDSDVLSWHGLPGDGLGGMMTSANPGLLKTSYQQEFSPANDGQDFKTKLIGLPLQVSSTKPIFTNWWSKTPVEIRSRLRFNTRTQLLSGTISNPFDFELHNVRLVLGNDAYLLNKPLGTDDAFDIQTEMDDKNLNSLLTRKVKQSKSDRSDNTRWDPTDTRVSRIADIMMFYNAAGGGNYTGLTNGYQSFVDMSDLINLKRAVLIAEIKTPGALLKINGESSTKPYDTVTTIVRIVYPVEYLKNRNSK